MSEYRASLGPGASVLTSPRMNSALLTMQFISSRAQTPLQRLENALHPVVDYGIMPIFALANAGVVMGGNLGEVLASPVTMGTALGLVVGKPVGVLLSVVLVAKFFGGLPKGMRLGHFLGAGMLAGIGFTMSLFIAALAFDGDPDLLTGAKTAILGASCLAGVAGYLLLRSVPAAEE